MVVHFCQFPLTLSCNLRIHWFFSYMLLIKDRIWTIFNSFVLKIFINAFLLDHNFKDLIGERSATSRGPVPDQSATSCIKSQRGPHEVANQSPIGRQPVPDQSSTSRRTTAKPSYDSSATSSIVMNFGRGEVAEQLQCMSDRGLNMHWDVRIAFTVNMVHMYPLLHEVTYTHV